MKKLLTILVALMLILCLFVGCADNSSTDDEEDEKTEEKDDKDADDEGNTDNEDNADNESNGDVTADERYNEKLVEKTVKNALDATIAIDFKKASEYLVDPEAYLEEVGVTSVEEMKEAMNSELGLGFEGIMDPMIDAIVDKMQSTTKYEILSCEEDGDNYIVRVKLTSIDDEDLNVQMEEKMAELSEEFIASEDMTKYESEEDIYAALYGFLIPEIATFIKNAEVETVTEETDVVVVNVDGTWLIDSEASGDIFNSSLQ